MLKIIQHYWPAIALAGLLGITALGSWKGGAHFVQQDFDNYITQRKLDDKALLAQASENERALEGRYQDAVRTTEAAHTEQERLRTVLTIAAGTSDRLRNELETTRSNLRGQGEYSSLADRSASATRAAMVLSELLGSCTGRLVDLGGAVDQAQSRGRQCEASYDSVRQLNNSNQ